MSEFECYQGHLMKPSNGSRCKICGSGLYLMDGKTAKQLAHEDDLYDARCLAEDLKQERENDEGDEEDDETLPGRDPSR